MGKHLAGQVLMLFPFLPSHPPARSPSPHIADDRILDHCAVGYDSRANKVM